MRTLRLIATGALLLFIGFLAWPLQAAKYDPGASDTEIKLGSTHPLSGPVSGYGVIGQAISAYFNRVNDEGGINGRKIVFIDLDDGYNPTKTVEQTRRLVEQEQVLAIVAPLGTAPNTATRQYLNLRKIPQIFVGSNSDSFGDPERFPWTMAFQTTSRTEGKIFARFVIEQVPYAKVGILYQNDDFGKDYLAGFRAGLGSRTDAVVSEQSYQVTDPTIDSQIVALKNSGANVFFIASTPRFAAQAIRKAGDLGWKPLQVLPLVAASIGGVLQPAGFENSQGIVSSAFFKDPDDPTWANDADMKAWRRWMERYLPGANMHDQFYVAGYLFAATAAQTLKQCGDDLTRENVMRQAANLKDIALPMFLPGIKINTSPTDYHPLEQIQLQRFEGKQWVLFGKVLSDR